MWVWGGGSKIRTHEDEHCKFLHGAVRVLCVYALPCNTDATARECFTPSGMIPGSCVSSGSRGNHLACLRFHLSGFVR